MSDRDITVAALRWHAARARRLAVGREKRHADKLDGLQGLWLQNETSRRLTEAKRAEQAALRALSKACDAQRGGVELVKGVRRLTLEAE